MEDGRDYPKCTEKSMIIIINIKYKLLQNCFNICCRSPS